jgi:hypothetical protein
VETRRLSRANRVLDPDNLPESQADESMSLAVSQLHRQVRDTVRVSVSILVSSEKLCIAIMLA